MSDEIYILDTSAILSGFVINSNKQMIPSKVFEEIKKGKAKRDLDLNIDNIEIVEPDLKYENMVKDAARITNDFLKLSQTDIAVLAAAIQYNAIIITNDYAIQNVAKFMNINFQNFGMNQIKKLVIWKYKCTGCSRYFDRYYKECPICGSPIKRVRK